MPTIYKVLGQVAPAVTTTVDLYAVPPATNAVTSTLMVCNRLGANAAYNIAIRPANTALANQHYIAFNSLIPANDSIALTIGMSLGANDVVTVQANTPNVMGFSLFGTEIT